MTVLPNLPQLADEEVEALFGADTDGARRYRLLHAVLVRGATQREAASEAGVSERTVRNVLRAYARSGSLETLRSRAPGLHRRRSRRTAAYEQALSDALAEEPLAGGDRLWRRAQELLGPEGGQLSRRTAYRLLAQLRARARKSAPPGLASAVRGALPLLLEDPPLTLGAGTLAQRLLPDESDPLLRGTVLQQALRAAIER
ncbi:MAG TPA: helix-turn-helix domain-containing protein, partial [Roseiflexaceae bacterium]|nr:helix-turn-helix domain-containing protein [Roseiflexaceae bacterium]